jgi:hypothetical protein
MSETPELSEIELDRGPLDLAGQGTPPLSFCGPHRRDRSYLADTVSTLRANGILELGVAKMKEDLEFIYFPGAQGAMVVCGCVAED